MKVVELESRNPLVRKFHIKREGEEELRPHVAIDAEGIPQLDSPHPDKSDCFVINKKVIPLTHDLYESTVEYGGEKEQTGAAKRLKMEKAETEKFIAEYEELCRKYGLILTAGYYNEPEPHLAKANVEEIGSHIDFIKSNIE